MTPRREQEILAEAARLRDSDPKGWPWAVLARKLGVKVIWLRRRLDPEWVQRERNRNRKGQARVSRDEVRARRATRPADTRDLTGQLLGDPVYEESALARRRAREAGKSIAREAREFMEARR